MWWINWAYVQRGRFSEEFHMSIRLETLVQSWGWASELRYDSFPRLWFKGWFVN